MYSLANMQLETQKLFQDSSLWRMCALWTFMIASFDVLPNLHARNRSMLNNRVLFSFCNKRTSARVLSGGIIICVLCQGFSLVLICSAWSLHACLLWLWFLEMRLNIVCKFCKWKISCLTLALTNAAFLLLNWTYASVKQRVETFQKMLVCNPPLWFLTEHWCAKTLSCPFSNVLILKSHTQSRYCVSVSVVPRLHCLLLVVSTL